MKPTTGSRTGRGAHSVFDQMSSREGGGAERKGARSVHTVLVVDDHDALRYATRKVLQRAGFTTIEAPTGEDAMMKAASAAAVVLDVNLPDVNGIEVLSSIRRELGSKPVILTSAFFVDDLHRTVGLEAGADAYLLAPLDPKELTSTLDALLGIGQA